MATDRLSMLLMLLRFYRKDVTTHPTQRSLERRALSGVSSYDWSKEHLTHGGTVTSDGLACFNVVTETKRWHYKIVCGGGQASVEESAFYCVNTVLGNLKCALRTPPMPGKLLKIGLG